MEKSLRSGDVCLVVNNTGENLFGYGYLNDGDIILVDEEADLQFVKSFKVEVDLIRFRWVEDRFLVKIGRL